jgi:transcriptional regulator with XRE-family HTH domain
MARAALQIGIRDLAELAKVAASTIARFEAGDELKGRTIDALRAALEKAGIEFIAENGGGPGVRLKKTATGAEEISQQIAALEETISSISAPLERSPKAALNTMKKAIAENDLAKLKNHRKRIKETGSRKRVN